MIIIDKNEGAKITHSLRTTKLTLGDELTIDLSKYERDFAVHLDFCFNPFGMLTMGISERYAAQVDIPARSYSYLDNGVDDEGKPLTTKVAVPLDTDKVTLTLWAVGV